MDSVQHRRRQHASARHYIDKATHSVALEQTVALAASMFHFPMAQVNVLDMDDQYTIASYGTPLGIRPRGTSLCDHVVRSGETTTLDEIIGIPSETEHIKTYVGVPIVGREGLVIATLCLLDTVPRLFSADQLEQLQNAASVIRDQLELLRRLEPLPDNSPAVAAELAEAVEAGQIVPVYQPVVGLRDGQVHAVEALARWNHPVRGRLNPDSFVPLAEDSEVIIDLDLDILRQSVADLARWNRKWPQLRLNANLSARHFDHPECVDRLTDVVVGAGVCPTQVTFEVTETVAFAAHPGDRSFLHDLRARGFQVALDDFGMGFSSITQVLRLPIDSIKIDREVTAASGNPVGGAVMRALLGLGADLHMETVVEGIETVAQADRARRFGAVHGQGYFFGVPMHPADVPSWRGVVRQ